MKLKWLFWVIVAALFAAGNVYADHIVYAPGDTWGNVITIDDGTVHIGGGEFSDLSYAVTGGESSLTHVPSPLYPDWSNPCRCMRTGEPMPHGTTIHILSNNGQHSWEWIASDGNDRPEDFVSWWKSANGPGSHGYDIDDFLKGYYGVGSALGGAGGGYLPAATAGSAGRTTSTFFTNIVMPKAQTRTQAKAAREAENGFKPRAVTPALRYEYVDLENIGDGDFYGMTAGFDWALNNTTVGVLVPYDYMDYDFINGNRVGSILYGRYDYHVSNKLTLGASANFNYMHTFLNSDTLDDVNLYGGGMGLTATYDADKFVPSFAFAYQYSEDDTDMDDDHQHLIKMGLNFGYRLGDSLVLNAYGIWNYDITDYTVDADNDYFDLGGEVSYNITETWGFNVGYKRILDLTDYSSDQVYLGTLWRF